jgi:N-acetylglucosamine kinase-like BadF-type ATPase
MGCGEVIELLEKVMRGQVHVRSRFAPQVFECAVAGDGVAQSIVRRAGTTIGANVLSVADELGMLEEPFDLVTAGGVFSSGAPLLYESLSETIHVRAKQVNVVQLQALPVVGALLLAFDLLDLPVLPEATRLAVGVSEALAS